MALLDENPTSEAQALHEANQMSRFQNARWRNFGAAPNGRLRRKQWEHSHLDFLSKLESTYVVDDLVSRSGVSVSSDRALSRTSSFDLSCSPDARFTGVRGGSLFSKATFEDDPTLGSQFCSAKNLSALGLEADAAVTELDLTSPWDTAMPLSKQFHTERKLHDTADSISRLVRLSFTKAHNRRRSRSSAAADDASSAFLGNELSVHHGSVFASGKQVLDRADTQQEANGTQIPAVLLPLVLRADLEAAVPSDCAKRWIIPAVIAGVSAELMPLVLGSCPHRPLPQSGDVDWFSAYQLGRVQVTRLDGGTDAENSAPVLKPYHRYFLLKQNYLLEYTSACTAEVAPVGFMNLCKAKIAAGSSNPAVHTIEITALVAPVGDSKHVNSVSHDESTLTVALEAPDSSTADRWLIVLQESASLHLDDLYELIPDTTTIDHEDPPELGVLDMDMDMAQSDSDLEPEELGRGRFSTVLKACRRSAQAGTPITQRDMSALKLINKGLFYQRVAEGKERIDTLIRESLLQTTLTAQWTAEQLDHQSACNDHKHSHHSSHGHSHTSGYNRTQSATECPIVRLKGLFETDTHLCLEMELCSTVDLFDKISASGVLSETEGARLGLNVLRAADFCYSHGIAHRDIKLSNLVYPSDASHITDSGNVRLADFGMAGRRRNNGLLYGRCGTAGFVAPELLMSGKNQGYQPNVDAFSVGVVLFIALCGYEPFYGDDEAELIECNKAGEWEFCEEDWAGISQEAQDLISKLLERDPAKRWTPAQALDHPWLVRHDRRRHESLDISHTSSTPTAQAFRHSQPARCVIA